MYQRTVNKYQPISETVIGDAQCNSTQNYIGNPKATLKPGTPHTIYLQQEKFVHLFFNTMGGVSIVNIVWQKYFYSPAWSLLALIASPEEAGTAIL